jgi:hypothetical protein
LSAGQGKFSTDLKQKPGKAPVPGKGYWEVWLPEVQAHWPCPGSQGQPLLFGFSSPEQQESFPEEYKEVISEVQALDINHTTPLQALEILYSFKQKLNEKEHGK